MRALRISIIFSHSPIQIQHLVLLIRFNTLHIDRECRPIVPSIIPHLYTPTLRLLYRSGVLSVLITLLCSLFLFSTTTPAQTITPLDDIHLDHGSNVNTLVKKHREKPAYIASPKLKSQANDNIPVYYPGQQAPKPTSSNSKRPKPISASISKSQFLPPEMYGTWELTSKLIDTNARREIGHVTHNIWVLQRMGEQVILSNPNTGASTSIQVDNVRGTTATFHHISIPQKNLILFEMPTITVDKDRLKGITYNKSQKTNSKGAIVKSYYYQYQLEGRRIGGSRIKFKNEEETDDLDFEVEEVQYRR